jgi:D-3-phosphoglycerate dehydrogenase
MIRVLNAEPAGYAPEARAILQGVAEVTEAALPRPALLRALPDYDVLIVRLGHQVDGELLAAGRRLLAVVTATTGLDHVDEAGAARRGVAVLSLRGEAAFLRTVAATAEHTWALLLALLRRVPAAVEAVRAGGWDRDAFRGRELAGRRIGLVGLGRLGRRVARYALAFEMPVAAHDPYATDWPDDVERAGSLADLLVRSDVLSIHVPLTAETRGLVGRRELAALPVGAVLLNTARGDVVEPEGLLWALQSGHLAGAALDVLPGEREPGRAAAAALLAYARARDNLLITPHVGGATVESMARTEVFMARKLVSFLRARGLDPRSVPAPAGREARP